MVRNKAEEDAIIKSIRDGVHSEVGDIKGQTLSVGSLREEASLCLMIDKLEGSISDLAVLYERTPEGKLNPPPSMKEMLAFLSKTMAKINSEMSRIAILAEDIISEAGRQMFDSVKEFFNERVMRFMPKIADYLQLQSWSVGISAAGFASLTFTFGAQRP